ncbi:MAG: hypothetical protein ACKOI3_01625, partial [Actinomycetota bacterium]
MPEQRPAAALSLVPVGRADVGFLPGGLEEKLEPWMSAIHDAIVALPQERPRRKVTDSSVSWPRSERSSIS